MTVEKNNFEKLQIWQIAMEIVKEVYILTKAFPKDEMYGITLQLKRAAVSVSLNIAEGSSRGFNKVFVQFLYQARGSLIEVKAVLLICVEVKIISVDNILLLQERIDVCLRKLASLIKFLKTTEGYVGKKPTNIHS